MDLKECIQYSYLIYNYEHKILYLIIKNLKFD